MLMPGSPDVDFEDWQWDILLADPETYSPRERTLVDHWMEFGEVYHCEVTEMAGGVTVYKTDLGTPESVVEVKIPSHIEQREALRAVCRLIYVLNS